MKSFLKTKQNQANNVELTSGMSQEEKGTEF